METAVRLSPRSGPRCLRLGLLDNPDEDLTTGQACTRSRLFDAELDHAVRAFQQHRGLLVDGVVGEATYRALKEASYRLGARALLSPIRRPALRRRRSRLCRPGCRNLGFYTGLVDGYFGLQTHNALMSYQREAGMGRQRRVSARKRCAPCTF